jgi:hypothetical protein
MKVTPFAAIIGVGGVLIMSAIATAAPHLVVVSQNTTDVFLTANGLQSAVIGMTGFAAGENLQGFISTSNYSYALWTSSNDGFFNVDSSPSFDGQSQWAANALNAPPNGAWDTGVLANPTTNALGPITAGVGSNPIGFAQFGVNHNSGPGDDVIWRSLNANGVAVAGTANLFRLTWSADHSSTFSAVMEVNSGGGTFDVIPVSITIPAVPAPGAVFLFGMAGIIGKLSRRRA